MKKTEKTEKKEKKEIQKFLSSVVTYLDTPTAELKEELKKDITKIENYFNEIENIAQPVIIKDSDNFLKLGRANFAQFSVLPLPVCYFYSRFSGFF